MIGPGTGSASFDEFGVAKYQNRRTVQSTFSPSVTFINIHIHFSLADEQL
jgi:hypothetical protein